MSPLSLKVTLEQMCQGAVMTYAECFQMEYRMATRMMENPDFFEGVRAVVVDKDRNPKWTKRDITKVTAEHLWARNEHELKATEQLARTEWTTLAASGALRVFVQTVDLSNPTDYTTKVDHMMAELTTQTYERVFLVHNAGSLGPLGIVQECISSPVDVAKYWELNLTSVMWLNKRFLDLYGASRDEVFAPPSVSASKKTQLVIVNITSMSGVKPFKTYTIYCTGKAAREMHHGVIAKEQAEIGNVRVLQYSPGPMDTDMQKTVRESDSVDPERRKVFKEMKVQGTLAPTAQSSERCVQLAIGDKYDTGARFDFFSLNRVGHAKLFS
ncbi:hypothetical protein PsorP6_003515 [Peronosclerospora sorghi]|uniref:Uncharacterized protein n=1 Tax=Peronosclerospora sorghi TaxID=230839 RepID=A0ACC0VRI1_9STRA|nr:hypothetical protein PsorP6_003515 [Peronosclerospora sorghi]